MTNLTFYWGEHTITDTQASEQFKIFLLWSFSKSGRETNSLENNETFSRAVLSQWRKLHPIQQLNYFLDSFNEGIIKKNIIQKLHESATLGVPSPDTAKFMTDNGFDIMTTSPFYKKLIIERIARWGDKNIPIVCIE
jgi:hypothetical protein